MTWEKSPPIKTHPYQLQCWCYPTRNFEPLYGCEYSTKEEGLAAFNRMLIEGRATGVRLVKRSYVRSSFKDRMIIQGPLPRSYLDYQMEKHVHKYDEITKELGQS